MNVTDAAEFLKKKKQKQLNHHIQSTFTLIFTSMCHVMSQHSNTPSPLHLHHAVYSKLSPHSGLPVSVTKQTHREQHNCCLSPCRIKAPSFSCFQYKKPTHACIKSHHPQGQWRRGEMERKSRKDEGKQRSDIHVCCDGRSVGGMSLHRWFSQRCDL